MGMDSERASELMQYPLKPTGRDLISKQPLPQCCPATTANWRIKRLLRNRRDGKTSRSNTSQ